MPVQPTRGEVWEAELNPMRGHEQAGTRPVLVLSNDTFNQGPAGMVVERHDVRDLERLGVAGAGRLIGIAVEARLLEDDESRRVLVQPFSELLEGAGVAGDDTISVGRPDLVVDVRGRRHLEARGLPDELGLGVLDNAVGMPHDSDICTTYRYMHSDESQAQEAVAAIGQALYGPDRKTGT